MEEVKIELKCPKCEMVDHDENHFCRCEVRNIKLAKQYRKDGVNLWKKPDTLKHLAEN